tara:strand:+ start:201 stop:785 length:585 start_codon:yes stop_codon:yes gene_type:complete
MKKDRKELEDTKAKVRVEPLFPNLIAIKNLNLSNLKIIGKKFTKTFESKVKTTLKGNTLFDKNSMNYLNIQLTETLSYLLKPYCENFVFNVDGIWINRYDKKDYQGSHVHSSDFSFIIYYKTDKSHTVFNSPVKNLLETKVSKIFNINYETNFKQGDMIVFPSYLEHWVKPNSNNITVSGNIEIIELIKNESSI